ncbi:hypothetical protein DACRYDRAFT_21343 [Dacryopinax primogenitus]|uniref:Microtubule binding protein n=1 Tax=Dacryopinax primogenitus (strain DJM 731) TaxID=1858805 RepID=M5GE45_DACPD|nr:uncharacterized protein DACRYDRAFT_21343 [Dacryopinax primogenitus]EJU02968.1 hypothetical protein DACRYDRAFT_21343 [Dacryopinax primogenitus]
MSGGESRTELLQWLNDVLHVNYTKVEQCGTGAAYCQIMDSIYGDVPMSKVKMNARQEYEYLNNFKVLQNVFKAKKIDKPIPVDKLVKCKMQDNLEFLQWIRRYWEQMYGGQPYDAIARRKGQPGEPAAPASSRLTSSSSARPTARATSAARGTSPEIVLQLQTQVRELQTNMEGLEKERDFYFGKLRDIEILVQQQADALAAEGKDDDVLKEIQKILYSTEEGFEVPEGAEGEGEVVGDEEETF